MSQEAKDLPSIWRQTQIPVVYKQAKPPLMIKLPFANDNSVWLREGKSRHRPEWNAQYKCWETPASWFEDSIKRILGRFKKVYVVQLHREHQTCAPACWNAQGVHCECSCMGAHHGSGHPNGRWYEVSETFAFHVGSKQYACRLLMSSI